MKAGSKRGAKAKRSSQSDPAVSYDAFKEYEGRKYTGVRIGRGHTWRYDPGDWKEKKITPDLWQISYAVTKRRAGKAPKGSGVPVGTEYHWYIVAHQHVRKLNANDYTTSMTGLKFKVAHMRADTERWSATPATRRKRMIAFLRQVIEELENPAPADEGATPDPRRVKSTRTAKAATTRGKGKAPPSVAKPTRRRKASARTKKA